MRHSPHSLSFLKNIIQLFLLCLLIITGCNFPKKKLIVNNKIVITGEAETQNPKQRLFLKTQLGNIQSTVSDNNFRFELEDKNVLMLHLVVLRYSGFPIFAKPGDSIHIKYNEIDLINEMAPPIFSGSRNVENNYLYKLNQILKYKDTAYDYFYNCTETNFFQKIDSLNHLGNNIIAQYKNGGKTDVECMRAMDNYLKYNLAYYVENYHSKLKGSFSKEIKGKSSRFLNYQKDLVSDDSLLLNNRAYCSFLEKKFFNEINNQVLVEGKKQQKKRWTDVTIKEQFEFTDLIFEEKAIKGYLRFCILYNRIHTSGVISKTDIERFEQTNPSSKYLKVIKNEFAQMPETLRESIVLPNYTFLDKNYEEKRLYDFKGKILYVDLWATWCGPCLAERKHFEALIEYFENEKDEIEFVGISLDKEFEREEWKNLVTRRNFEGTQLIAKNAFQSKICEDLKIYMIPRFIIIGRNGELIQSQALRPRQKEIRKVLTDIIRKS